MDFLLDTSAISTIMREDPRMASWFSLTTPQDRIITCTIVRGEILFGLERLPPGQRRAFLAEKAERIPSALICEPIPPSAADAYARVKAGQQRLGLPLDENDLWIAATAFAVGATVVSKDRDFQRVESLSVIVP